MKKLFENWRRFIKEGDDPMPSMRGIMDPEDPSVMKDIERKKNQSFRDEIEETHADEISALAMYMQDGITQREEAINVLMSDPQFQYESYNNEELDMIWELASEMLARM